MQTENLTWSQAYNLLLCGLAKYIEYQSGEWHNMYFIHKGKLCSQWHDDFADFRSTVGNRGSLFKVVEHPTWSKTIRLRNVN
jgi:hypothetical protein